MSGDIEEFLRRAAQRRAKQRAPAPKPVPPRPRPSQPYDAEVIDDVEIIDDMMSRDSVASHVEEHMQGHVFDEQVSHLGENVDRSDDKMEEHLQQVFEHNIGKLGAKTSAASDSSLDDDSPGQQQVASEPTNYLALLQNPESIRQAIILNEILARPTERW
jgi:hypothetical protein